MNQAKGESSLEKIVSLCKRRGFVYPNSEIYGGIQGFYDYGPLGVLMKKNIKDLWWRDNVLRRDDVVGIDGAIITHPMVWQASGHVANFGDVMVECKSCHKRFRPDLIENADKCPECGGEFTEGRKYNILFETEVGVIEGEKIHTYLRGEACQTIYLDFLNVVDSMHLKIPFGIAQIGKAFRNEITPRYFLYRLREFEQWDIQYFIHPSEVDKWYEYWKKNRKDWYEKLLNKKDNIRLRQHSKDELAFYAKKAFDVEYHAPWGWAEWEGIHWRSDYDLSQHSKFSGQDLNYVDPVTKEKYLPWIVETSGGPDRAFLYLLLDAYEEELVLQKKRTVLHLNPLIAPYKAAVFPLLANKGDLVNKARKIYDDLKFEFSTVWDDRGNIGKRYFSQDEIGTPFCVTIDFDTLEDDTVTVRDRDTMRQERVKVKELNKYLKEKIV